MISVLMKMNTMKVSEVYRYTIILNFVDFITDFPIIRNVPFYTQASHRSFIQNSDQNKKNGNSSFNHYSD